MPVPRRAERIGIALAFVALAACSSAAAPDVPLPPLVLTNQLDVLFVIDNAVSEDVLTVLAANLPRFVSSLDALPGGRPDLHIGVVDSTVDLGVAFPPACPSPDAADDGRLQNAPRVAGCLPPSGRYIIDVESSSGGRTTNYTGTLDTTLSCITQLSATGCGYREDLEAMKRALDGSRPENAGFVRDTASLLIVFVSDEDDCSVADPAFYAAPGDGTVRCTLYGLMCDRPISITQPGTYTNCEPSTTSYLRPPSYYASFLGSIKDPRRIAIAALTGTATSTLTTEILQPDGTLWMKPSCTATINGNPATAYSGNRLVALADSFGELGRHYTICQSDYSGSLADVVELASQLVVPQRHS